MSVRDEKKFAFVVLNYGLYEKTVICVDDLIKKNTTDYCVIVVDNGSLDGSGKRLKENYGKTNRVRVIELEKNIGFSKGMNVGFRQAKQEGFSFIALINNDTRILSDGICETIEQDYMDYKFDILGPHIDNPDGENSSYINPYQRIEKTDDEIVKQCERFLKKTAWQSRFAKLHLGVPYMSLRNVVRKLYYAFKPVKANMQVSAPAKEQVITLGCGLNGCYLIFGPNYIKKYDGINPVTFAYGEEWLLYRQAHMDGLLMMYDSRIRIWHDEGSVQKMQSNNEIRRHLYRLKIERESYQQIIDYVNEERLNGRCFDNINSD